MQSLPCDVTISGQPFGPNSLTFGTPQNSTLLVTLNRALLEVRSWEARLEAHLHACCPVLAGCSSCLAAAPLSDRASLQVESNGVLDQLIRKWTTEIDQCATSAEVACYVIAAYAA